MAARVKYEEIERRVEKLSEKIEFRVNRVDDSEAYLKAFEEFEEKQWSEYGDGCSHLGFCELCNGGPPDD